MLYGIIYKIINTKNGKIYVGQTIQTLEERWKQHVRRSRNRKDPIGLAIKKYGAESFSLEILCECFTKEELDRKETEYGILLEALSPNGYSLRFGSGRGSVGKEIREKISRANTGKVRSEEEKSHLSFINKGEKHPQFGKPHGTKTYIFTQPNGEEIVVTNLAKFSRENNLNPGHMGAVALGKRKQHKGWTKGYEKTL